MGQVTVDLSAFSDDTILVAFLYTEDGGGSEGESGWFIDDVEVTGTQIVCDPVPVVEPPQGLLMR
jgi:hypothetical protein